MLDEMFDAFASALIFHNRQIKNYMTSTVSMPLNILRICEESQAAFYNCRDLLLVVTYTIFGDVLLQQ